MITGINTFSSTNQPTFMARPNVIRSGYAVLSGNSVHQVSSLKSVCKEILLRVNNNKKLITAATAALGGIKLTESAISFYTDEKDVIRLSMPCGAQGDLFKMQIIKDGKPENTVILDNFNKMVKSYSLNKMSFFKEKDVDKKLIDAFVEGVFDSVDEPLFQVRMFVRKNSTEPTVPVEKIRTVSMPNPVAIKEQKIVQEAEEKKNKKIIPTVDQMKSYSLPELIKHQAKIDAEKKAQERAKKPVRRVKKKINVRKLVPVKNLSEKQRANISSSKSNNTVPSLTLDKDFEVGSIVVDLKKESVIVKKKRNNGSKLSGKADKSVVDVAVAPKRRGRLPKFGEEKVLYPDSPAGIISADLQAKINEVLSIQKEITKFFKNYSFVTALKIRNAYGNVKTVKNKIIFDDFTISTPQRKELAGQNVLNIIDTVQNKSINIVDSKKIVANDLDWFSGLLPKLRFLPQEEMDKKLQAESFNTLINNILSRLNDFKYFLDNKLWLNTPENPKTNSLAGRISESSFARVKFLVEKYENIQNTLRAVPLNVSLGLKKDFGKVAIVKGSNRLEFINPLKDGSNLVFNVSSSKIGKFILILKHNGTEQLEDAYAVSIDGKMLKNVIRNKGIRSVVPSNPLQKIVYYSDEELLSNGIQNKFDEMLDVIEKTIIEYEKFVLDRVSSVVVPVNKFRTQDFLETEDKAVSVSNNANIKSNNVIDFDVVKEFFDKTINELQKKVEGGSEATGFKSVIENLKNKFDEFLIKSTKS